MDINTLLSSLEGSDKKIFVPVDPSYGDLLSNDDQKIFDAVLELCERSELFAVEPVIFFEGVGIYKYKDLFFERVVVDLYDPPFVMNENTNIICDGGCGYSTETAG